MFHRILYRRSGLCSHCCEVYVEPLILEHFSNERKRQQGVFFLLFNQSSKVTYRKWLAVCPVVGSMLTDSLKKKDI